MRFKDFKDEIARHSKDWSSEAEAVAELAINNIYFEIWNKANWLFARRDCIFSTVAKYNTGTVTATQYSTTVTGSGTTWTAAMEGRKIVINGDSQGYIIRTVSSTTSIILQGAYQGDTVAGKDYAIYKHIYRLDDRATKVLWAVNNKDVRRMQLINERKFDKTKTPYDAAYGTPRIYIPRGQTTSDYHNTGTVAVSASSPVVVGTGTTFTSDMVGMVFKVYGDDFEYVVLSYTSATQITLDTDYDGTANATAEYSIGPAGTEQIELWPAPDIVMEIRIKVQLRPLKMINNNDVPELPQHWHYGLLRGALRDYLPGRATDNSEIQIYADLYREFLTDIQGYHDINEDTNPTIEESEEETYPTDKNWQRVFGDY